MEAKGNLNEAIILPELPMSHRIFCRSPLYNETQLQSPSFQDKNVIMTLSEIHSITVLNIKLLLYLLYSILICGEQLYQLRLTPESPAEGGPSKGSTPRKKE